MLLAVHWNSKSATNIEKKTIRKTQICKKQANINWNKPKEKQPASSKKKTQLHKKTSPNSRENRNVGNTVARLLHILFFFLIAYVLTTTSSQTCLMWLNVIISLFALPNQITSGDLVCDQASFDFMTINTVCDRQCTVSCFVISFAILQHRVYWDRDCVLSGTFPLSRSTCDVCFDHPRSTVLALQGTSTTVCALALSEFFVFQLCRC